MQTNDQLERADRGPAIHGRSGRRGEGIGLARRAIEERQLHERLPGIRDQSTPFPRINSGNGILLRGVFKGRRRMDSGKPTRDWRSRYLSTHQGTARLPRYRMRRRSTGGWRTSNGRPGKAGSCALTSRRRPGLMKPWTAGSLKAPCSCADGARGPAVLQVGAAPRSSRPARAGDAPALRRAES